MCISVLFHCSFCLLCIDIAIFCSFHARAKANAGLGAERFPPGKFCSLVGIFVI